MLDAVHIGPPRSASTWLYKVLSEHPEVATPPVNSTQYFSIHYCLPGEDVTLPANKNKLNLDFCQDYLRHPLVPERLQDHNPDIKIICTLREPIERAFSHYWHEKSKKRYSCSFDEIFKHYDLYSTFMETGFYALHLNRYLEYFPRDQIKIMFFDDLVEDQRKFLSELYDFLEISHDFSSKFLHSKANTSRYKHNSGWKILSQTGELLDKLGLQGFRLYLNDKKVTDKLYQLVSSKDEYIQGVPQDIREKLLRRTIPEIENLEKMTGRNLNEWKQ